MAGEYCYLDIETAPLAEAGDYIDPVVVASPDYDAIKAPKNYTDPVKIAAYLERERIAAGEKYAAALEAAETKHRDDVARAALDLDLCRIVAIGWAQESLVVTTLAHDLDGEREALAEFWSLVSGARLTLVGFNCLAFDLPVMVRRSQYLGVQTPLLNLNRYRHPGIVDVMQLLSFDGLVRARTLSFYCRRFGITTGAEDIVTGADIGRLVEAGEWDMIQEHVSADVRKVRALFARILQSESPACSVIDKADSGWYGPEPPGAPAGATPPRRVLFTPWPGGLPSP